ncbi:MAG: acyltransferase [Proteobacteria bacterium]|nr:acyltransferase [Pseudomonadota bacterium]
MKKHQFAVLDGLRGLGALSVLGFHLFQQHKQSGFPFAGLAVDFFYMLSGFVMAFAYEQKLRTGKMDLKSFAWTRFVRLYPLLFLGTSMGIALGFLAASVKGDVTAQQIAVSGVLGLFLLPSYVFPQWSSAFPFNMASWSLTFEIFANAVFALVAPKLTTRVLVGVLALSAAALVAVALLNGSTYVGFDQGNFVYGFGRVLFPFFAGVLIFRFRLSPRLAPKAAFGLMALLLLCLLIPGGQPGLMTLPFVLLLFPCIIFFGAAVEVGPRVSNACRFAGTLSYPLYILQSPILRIGEEALKHVHLGTGGIWIFGLAEACVILAFSYAALTLFDVPVRRYIRSRSVRSGAMVVKGT